MPQLYTFTFHARCVGVFCIPEITGNISKIYFRFSVAEIFMYMCTCDLIGSRIAAVT